MKVTAFYQTVLGLIGITESGGVITELFFRKEGYPQDGKEQETPLLREAAKQVEEYFSGKRKSFALPLVAAATDFQKKVWAALGEIPYGETWSYKQVANYIGQPSAARAVGMANNKNPILIVTPCHRVVGADGKLVGYAGGLDRKEKLLALENHYGNL